MKVTWEAADIRPGRKVGKPDRTERWMIGYMPSGSVCLISLSDGMVTTSLGKDHLASSLNDRGELPEELL